MSSVASFYVVPESAVAVIPYAGSPRGLLITDGRAVPDVFLWSGYVLLYLLMYLEDHDLIEPPLRPLRDVFDAASFAFGAEHKVMVPRLDPSAQDVPAIAAAIRVDMDAPDFEEAEQAVVDGLAAMADQIKRLGDDEVLIVLIG